MQSQSGTMQGSVGCCPTLDVFHSELRVLEMPVDLELVQLV